MLPKHFTMLRYRRYRVFVVVAVIFTLLIFRIRHTRSWAQYPLTESLDTPPEKGGPIGGSTPAQTPRPVWTPSTKETPVSNAREKVPTPSPKPKDVVSPSPVSASPKATLESIPKVVLPERNPIPPTKVYTEEEESNLHPIAPPGRQELPSMSAIPTTIHWEKQLEHFPVPTESIIKLPTGAPVKIPKIQHNFNDETPNSKINREKRQTRVRDEFKRAWMGYKKHAWLHDELSPVSGKFRDPFCGWAATLVDTLDTLWIMGLEEEFEEAAKAINLIDFTTTKRADIPMFETTIRYMGGLLAAYDVSGGQYKNILAKAVELGEILMGAFDTPNRMPVLYYRWKPTFASQAHRAGQRSNTAELGSLSMEFTRLSQLTHDPKYYDAIARITNALSEWQDRGTLLPGVFPDDVDATGCNRTATVEMPKSAVTKATSPAKAAEEAIGFQPVSPDTVKEPKPKQKKIKDDTPMLEMEVLQGQPGKAQILGWDEKQPIAPGKQKVAKRDVDALPKVKKDEKELAAASVAGAKLPTNNDTGLPLDIPKAQAIIGEVAGEWDCVKQGLEPAMAGRGKFSMGGGQDSTYEYFPKQYLLLGGLDETYKKMYLKSREAIKQWMLFRPMVPDNRDILFSGSVTTAGDPEHDLKLSADVDHLTCFIGGMIGMAAKIYDLEGDLEIAKKLADGCVWAYESTATGIMPEGATVMPCKSSEHCPWNETAYWEFLDPAGPQRDLNLQDYLENRATREATQKAEAEEAEATLKEATAAAATTQNGTTPTTEEELPEQLLNDLLDTPGSESLKKAKPDTLSKRQMASGDISVAGKSVQPKSGTVNDDAPSLPTIPKTQGQLLYEQKSGQTEAELQAMAQSGRQAVIPVHPHELSSPLGPASETFVDPNQPLNHTEYVKQRILQDKLPPGFVTVKSRKYILRPEAIESVWYMYRLTGDETWQDKGWKMFESIINATSAEFGHSAIFDVLDPSPHQIDQMESFWLAETLKYFYLLYSTPDVISLDEWVLNTEAHPFKRPT